MYAFLLCSVTPAAERYTKRGFGVQLAAPSTSHFVSP
jgi:hypothetical protein